jgi:adenylate cyclase class 1
MKKGPESKIVKLRKSFDSYNVNRIYRAASKFSENEQNLFTVIPFLLHNNFTGSESITCPRNTPYGIELFEPRESHAKAFSRLFENVSLNEPGDVRGIVSLSLIGSLGTIGQSAHSDFDYVVLVDIEKQNEEERAALAVKLESIERWADESFSTDVNFYVTDVEDFRMNRFGQTDEDSIGTALGDVFKDEFYRTAIFVAGKRPLWWLTPPGYPSDRIEEFKKLIAGMEEISHNEYIDLGNIERADPAEFFGGVLWQINKAIVSPSKSILKMALLESYLLDPKSRLLSEKLKKKIFKYPDKVDEIDPYMMMFKRCENFYAKNRMQEELRLLRGAFLLKSGKTPRHLREILDEPSVKLTGEEHTLRSCMERWKWEGKNIDDLEDDFKFKVTGSYQSLGAVNSFFLNVYRRLSDWFERAEFGKPSIAKDDLAVLGRRIFTYFERKPGKIPFIYPGNTPARPPNHMKLVHEKSWVLHSLSSDSMRHRPEDGKEVPIVRLRSVMEIITWMVINKMWNPETRLYFGGQMSHGIGQDIKQMLDVMYDFFLGKPVFETTRASLLGGRYPLRALVVPNFGLNVSPRKLVHIDIVHQDTYGEYTYRRLTPADAYQAVTEMVQKAGGGEAGSAFSMKIAVPNSLDDPGLGAEFETALSKYQKEISGEAGKKKKAKLDL